MGSLGLIGLSILFIEFKYVSKLGYG
jgi:hypothetical protein